jgi:hypothetical protein
MMTQKGSTDIPQVSLTPALGGGWVVETTPRPLYPLERQPVPIVLEAGRAPGPVWTGAEIFTLTGTGSSP